MPYRLFGTGLLGILLLCLFSGRGLAQDAFRGTVTQVERGDQLSVKLDSWTLRVRLHGAVSSPDEPLATVAREWTKAHVLGRKVQVQVRGTAAKGIVYGDVVYSPNEHNLALELTEQGLATWAATYAPRRRDLEAAQQRARQARVGIWGSPQTEAARLTRLILQLNATPKPTPKPEPTTKPRPTAKPMPTAKPTPRPTPKPAPLPLVKKTPAVQKMLTPTKAVPRSGSTMALVLGILFCALCCVAAERVSRDARRLRRRPTLIPEIASRSGSVKLRGLARLQHAPVVSIVGRIPGIYLKEVTQVFRDSRWHTTYEETDSTPFFLEDGMGQLLLTPERLRYRPIRAARFYNDIPVEKWHARAYSGDVRSEILFIPSDVTITVFGDFASGQVTPLSVIEGDERRLTDRPLRLALVLVATGVGALLLGGYVTVLGSGSP